MFLSTGLLLVLAVSQVPAELLKADFFENVLSKESDADSRIVSGWQAYPGQHPHQVSLRMVNRAGGVSGCGGSLISRQWIITAAHCTDSQITAVVRVGVTELTTPQYILETHKWHNHPSYQEGNLAVQPNEIALMQLPISVTYSRLLQPIRIQPSDEAYRNYANEVVIASGFGRTWSDGATAETLNWVYLRAVSNADCAALFGSTLINDNAICARFYNVTSQSTCQGDSGGPLVHVGHDGVPVLIGVTSFVAGGNYGCHSGLPAGFVRPGPFLPWLEEVTGIDFENLNEEEEEVSTPQPEEPTTTEVTTQSPETTSTTAAPTSTTAAPTSTTAAPTPPPSTTTMRPSTTPEPEPEEEEDSDEDSSSEEDDPEISELLKKLIVKVKVKVNVNSSLKKKVKVKC